MAEKDKDDFYCVDFLKSACDPKEDIGVGGRVFFGLLGFVGMLTVDPVKRICKACGVKDDNPPADPDDPTAPCNQNY